jgi:hypothetical protein
MESVAVFGARWPLGETAREIDLLAPSPLEAIEAGALLLLAPGDSIE